MKKQVAWSITDQNVVVNYNGETHIVKRSDELSDQLISAIKEKRLEEIPMLVSAAKMIETYSAGTFTVKNGEVHVNGMAAPVQLSNKILKFSREKLPCEPLVKFAGKLQANPSFRAVNELFGFLEINDHPITEEGNFIAYKRVKADFTDIHTGTFDNSVGVTVEMPRNQVDEDCNRTCSNGLHVANWNYAHTQFASDNSSTDVMLEVEVDPSSVVAVPTDYNNSKMRVCKYKVLGVVTTPFEPSESLRTSPVVPTYELRCCDCDSLEDENDICGDCARCKEHCCDCDLENESEEEEDDDEAEDICAHCNEEYCNGDCKDEYPYEDELNKE